MMGGLRGIFAGALTLIALEAVLSSKHATARTSGALSAVATIVSRLLDPTIPAIPDRRSGSSSGSHSLTHDITTGAEVLGGLSTRVLH